MTPRLFVLSAISAALFSSHASAVGFGDITLSSRVGEPLRAEVPVFASAGEQIDSACFTLSPIPGSDLPVVSSARVKLIRRGQGHVLSITGSKPIVEPMFIVSLRAGCGIDLQRDFILMPQAPLLLMSAERDEPVLPVATPAPTRKQSSNFNEMRARDGDTLESIAEAQAPGSMVEQRRLIAAMQRANPGLAPDQPLLEGEAIRVPKMRRPAPAEADSSYEPPPKPRRADPPPAPASKPKKAPPREAPQPQAGSGADRVVLGSPPEELKPGEKAVAPRGSQQETDERMLKLEATLNLLSQEVDKLNSALALATEALAVQEKLRAAQASQALAANAPTVSAAVPPAATQERSNQSNWLELIASALIGGGIAAGAAHLISRQRRAPSVRDELPLSFSGNQKSVGSSEPRSAPEQVIPDEPLAAKAEVVVTAATKVDIPLDNSVSGFGNDTGTTVDVSENDSVLELAEIMLSFGRIRGAAETLALHIEERSPDNIQPWTMLLDLYRRGDMHAEFDSLAAKMRTKFNVSIPAWEDSTEPVSGLKSLEDYAHIVGRAIHTWGTQDCLDYLYELVHNNRAGQRSGFPLEVVEEITLLILVLETGYGIRRPG